MRKLLSLTLVAALGVSAAALSSPAKAGVVVGVGVPGVVVAAPVPAPVVGFPSVVAAYPRPWAYGYAPWWGVRAGFGPGFYGYRGGFGFHGPVVRGGWHR